MAHETLDDLTSSEQLLLLAWRRDAGQHAGDACAEIAWRLGGGDAAGGRCAGAFRDFAARLRAFARRPMAVNPPPRAALTMDERCVLELVGACQCGAPAMAVALARWLVRAPAHVAVLATAAGLARAMDDAGLHVRAPSEFRADPPRVHHEAALTA